LKFYASADAPGPVKTPGRHDGLGSEHRMGQP
jgi:hypothetical protein